METSSVLVYLCDIKFDLCYFEVLYYLGLREADFLTKLEACYIRVHSHELCRNSSQYLIQDNAAD